MAFQSGFAASLIINGKPQRELNESGNRTVRIPFGSEYAIRVKNKTKARAYVSIDIDGTDVLGGKVLMRAGQTVDFERFVVDGDLLKGKRFKFVTALHGDVQDPTSEDNGSIRVTVEPEYIFSTYTNTFYSSNSGARRGGDGSTLEGSSLLRGTNISTNGPVGSTSGGAQGVGGTAHGVVNCATTAHNYHVNSQPIGMPMSYQSEAHLVESDAGATVEGSASNQKFESTSEWFYTTTPIYIDLYLKGPRVAVTQPVQQQWYEFEFMGKKAKSVVPLSQLSQKHMEQAAYAIARAEVANQRINGLTILADSVMVA